MQLLVPLCYNSKWLEISKILYLQKRHLTLLPGFIHDLNIVHEYQRVKHKKCHKLWVQVNLASKEKNSDVEFWRVACERYKYLLETNQWRSKDVLIDKPEVSNSERHQKENDVHLRGEGFWQKKHKQNSAISKKKNDNQIHQDCKINSLKDSSTYQYSRRQNHEDYEMSSDTSNETPLFPPQLVVNLHSVFHKVNYYDVSINQLVIRDSFSFLPSYSARDIAILATTLSNSLCPDSYAHWFEVIGNHLTSSTFTQMQLSKLNCELLVQLIRGFAKSNVSHQDLFQKVAALLIERFNGMRIIDGWLLVDTVDSYANMGFRHKRLLEAISEKLVIAKFEESQLMTLQRAYRVLQFESTSLECLLRLNFEKLS